MAKKIVWAVVATTVAVLLVAALLRTHRLRLLSTALTLPIEGAVMERASDPKKEQPIANVQVTATDGATSATAQSDSSGYFKFVLHRDVLSGQPVVLHFRSPQYEPLDMTLETGRLITPAKLYLAPMKPISTVSPEAGSTVAVVTEIRVRYTLNSQSETNIGSAVKTFEVVNQANVPCDRKSLCSPDGKWKAASASATLDAGAGNTFRNIRASCIGGPCPFTRIDSSGFTEGSQTIKVSAQDWSDTATFLMEAEVYRSQMSSDVRELYPVIFGRTLSFTVPPTQEGVSFEAEINRSPMVFPLSPDLYLSWATCTARTGSEAGNEQEKTMVYSCELKPGYRF